MRKLLLLFLLAAGIAGAQGWGFVQYNDNTCTGNISTCTVTLSPTAGHTLVMGFTGGSSAAHISSVTGGGTWSLCTAGACESGPVGGFYQDNAFTTNATGGAQTYTVTLNAALGSGGFFALFVMEFSCAGCTALGYDTGGGNVVSSCSTTCTMTNLTLTGSYDLIVHVITGAANTPTSCGSLTLNSSNAFCYGLNQTSGGALNGAQTPAGAWIDSAIAIKATSGSVAYTRAGTELIPNTPPGFWAWGASGPPDAVPLMDAAKGLAAHFAAPKELVLLAEFGSGHAVHFGATTDQLILTDAGSTHLGRYASFTDTVPVHDAGAGMAAHLAATSDIVSVRDTGTGLAAHLAAAVDYLTSIFDSALGLKNPGGAHYTAATFDLVLVIDTAAASHGYYPAGSDKVFVLDAATGHAAHVAMPAELIVLHEAAAPHGVHSTTATDFLRVFNPASGVKNPITQLLHLLMLMGIGE